MNNMHNALLNKSLPLAGVRGDDKPRTTNDGGGGYSVIVTDCRWENENKNSSHATPLPSTPVCEIATIRSG